MPDQDQVLAGMLSEQAASRRGNPRTTRLQRLPRGMGGAIRRLERTTYDDREVVDPADPANVLPEPIDDCDVTVVRSCALWTALGSGDEYHAPR